MFCNSKNPEKNFFKGLIEPSFLILTFRVAAISLNKRNMIISKMYYATFGKCSIIYA